MIQRHFKLKLIVLALSILVLPVNAQSSSVRTLVVKCQTVFSRLFSYGSDHSEHRDQVLQRLFQSEMLATLAGVKPASWPIYISPYENNEGILQGQRAVKEAIESNQLANSNMQWIFTQSQIIKNQFDAYVLNRRAVENLVRQRSVQNALNSLRVWKVKKFSYIDVVASFKDAATYWSQRKHINPHSKENLDKTYDFDVLAGLLFGFEPSDVLFWARSRQAGENPSHRAFIFYRDQDFYLGSYATFQAVETSLQLFQQEQARVAVSKYLHFRNRGLNNYEIYNQWPKQISIELGITSSIAK